MGHHLPDGRALTDQHELTPSLSQAYVWFGFVVTTIMVNQRFNGGAILTVIDAGHWLAVLLAEGAILGAVR
jgi:hypothetical protein